METLHKIITPVGVSTCGEIDVTAQEWLALLQQEEAKDYIETLLCFLREPEQQSSCRSISLKYGKSAQHYNSKITNFSKWVQKKLYRFQVVDYNGMPTYWCITMKSGKETSQEFLWKMRDELVEALRSYLMENLITQLKKNPPFNGYEEAYKWHLLDEAEGKDGVEIAQLLTLPGNNLIGNKWVNKPIEYLLQEKKGDFAICLDKLFDESQPLNDRLQTFKTEMKAMCPESISFCAHDERTAAAFLTCKYPHTYTIYQNDVYQLICQYFGYQTKSAGQKLSHFISIIDKFVKQFGKEVQSVMQKEVEQFQNQPLNLAVQTLFWCMKGYMANKTKHTKNNYWLVGYTINNTPQFERFFSDGVWESWYNDASSSDQGLLKLAKSIRKGDIIILKSTSTKGPKHDIPFLRVKGIGIATSDVETLKTNTATQCTCSVHYLSTEEIDFDGPKYGAFRKTIHKSNSNVQAIIDYVNNLMEMQNQTSNSQYAYHIDLLKETHNLVLTGAPGTGKTHMAQAMAKEMGCGENEMCFVQFHPSYDYTDFVEGLRPVENGDGQIGFERKDGVFKGFCKRAIKNLVDAEKSVETLKEELSWEEKMQTFVEEAIENKSKLYLTIGKDFVIEENRGDTLLVRNENNEKRPLVSVPTNDILQLLLQNVLLEKVKNIREHFDRKFNTQADSYTFAITNEIRKMKTELPAPKVEKIPRKDFVFIIDEINRGEASKIFGDLFYAIDPGYRGKKEIRVKTQYQNLVPESDIFAKGFYVPENVYILATMNDIDRSVESMDFAMRRRFTWKEITPNETISMLDSLSCAQEAKKTMIRLNEEIANTDGLGAAYMVGPSYFLRLEKNDGDFEKLWKLNIEPLLKEYLRGIRKSEDILENLKTAYFASTQEAETEAPDLS